MTHIRKVFGAPGTGKTTHLIKEIQKDIRELDITLGSVVYISVTNTAMEEVRDRLGITKEGPGRFFRTLHGLALSHLLAHGKEIDEELYFAAKNTLSLRGFVEGAKIRFCKKNNIDYERDVVGSESDGNMAFEAWSYIISKYYMKFEDIDKCLTAFERLYRDKGRLVGIIKKWIEYKEKNSLIDYEDLLIYAYENGVNFGFEHRVVKIDEAQDFSELEWEIIKRSFIEHEIPPDRITLAGDDDQAILAFRGASAEKFLEFEADEEIVLSKTHRLPENILNFANTIIRPVRNRKPKEFEPASPGGAVVYRAFTSIPSLARFAVKIARENKDKSVFLLFYTNNMVRKAETALFALEQPFRRLKGESLWEKEIITAWNIAAKLRNNQKLSYEEFCFMLKHIKKNLATSDEKREWKKSYKEHGIPIQFYHMIKKYQIHQLFDSRSFIYPDTLKIISRAKTTIEVGRVNLFVDTIHAAKGREADIVIFANAITKKICDESTDDLRRVFYVAATRARRAVVVANIMSHNPPLFPFLRVELRGWGVEGIAAA